MSPAPKAPERVNRPHGLNGRHRDNFKPANLHEPFEVGSPGLSLSSLDDEGELHARDR